MSQSQWQQVAQWLREAKRAVAFTGAGISTESGIPDFRSPGGVWSRTQPVYFDAFLNNASARQEYWRQKCAQHREFAAAQPNAGHLALAEWERRGLLEGVITQNIDGLHYDAGSRNIFELHGTNRFVVCLTCEARYEPGPLVEQFLAGEVPPDCPECGGFLKHATISFGQALPGDVLANAWRLAGGSDLFFAIGSSLVVEPAASLPRIAKERGARLVIINRDSTPQDDTADLVLRSAIGETLAGIDACLAAARQS